MAQAISCNYARTAIRVLSQKEFTHCGNAKSLTRASVVNEVEQYNTRFSEVPQLQLSLAVAHKRIHPLLDTFNRKWHPESQKDLFLLFNCLDAFAYGREKKA